jgi:uncharacterized protein (TIGR00255 family)
MKSMTGYACREITRDGMNLSVEIKGYNSRFLELSVNLPPWLSSLEPRIRDLMSSRINRGKIEISVRLRELNAKISVSVNTEAALAYQKAVSLLAEELGTGERPNLALILGLEGVLEVEKNRDDDRYWKQIEPVLLKAAEDFDVERIREGRHTEADILSHIGAIESALQTVAARAPALETSIRENLRNRFAELLGNQIDENRILTETAALLVKYSISEEISRLSSHLAEFRAETQRNPGPGKKLDFLCQEINREINTVGSKTTVLEVSRAVVDMKDALENVREQLRNVE